MFFMEWNISFQSASNIFEFALHLDDSRDASSKASSALIRPCRKKESDGHFHSVCATPRHGNREYRRERRPPASSDVKG